MIVGFDYFNTITKHPEIFTVISKMVKRMGGEVYVISAIGDRSTEMIDKYANSVKSFLDDIGLEYDVIRIFTFIDPTEIPQKKVDNAKNLKIEYFFDDRGDVCNAMAASGIVVCRVK